MDASIRRIHLYGDLAERFGDVLEIHAKSVAHAVQIIEANFPGQFMKFLRERAFFVWYDDEDKSLVALDEMVVGTSHSDLHIMPAISGESKKGGLMAVLGVVLIGAAIVFSGGTLAAPLQSLAATQGTIWGTVAQLGVGLLLSGVAQMLAPVPDFESQPNEEDRPSYIYSGPSNTEYEGGAIPVIYGAPYVGSVVVSASLQIEQINYGAPSEPPEEVLPPNDLSDLLNPDQEYGGGAD